MTASRDARVRPLAHPPGHVMVLQLKRLGDLVLTTPALLALRTAWPKARLTLVTEAPFHEVLAGFAGIDALELHPRGGLRSLAFGERLGRMGPEIVFDFQGSATSARLALQSRAPRRIGWDRRVRRLTYTDVVAAGPPSLARFTGDQKLDFLRAVGLDPGPAIPRLSPPPGAASEGLQRLAAAGVSAERGYVVLAPASRRAYKRWKPESWAALLHGLEDAGRGPVLLAGGPGESDQVDAVARACRHLGPAPPALAVPTLGVWLGLLNGARLVVAPDGGVRQMAQGLGRPTFGLFGPQNPAHWLCPVPPGAQRGVAGRRPGCVVRCSAGAAPCVCLAALPPERVLAQILTGVGEADDGRLG